MGFFVKNVVLFESEERVLLFNGAQCQVSSHAYI